MSLDAIVTRADQLIAMGQQVITTRKRSDYDVEYVDGAQMKGFRVAVLSFIDRVYGREHPHFTEFQGSTNCYDPCGSPWMMEDTGGVRASAGRGRSIL